MTYLDEMDEESANTALKELVTMHDLQARTASLMVSQWEMDAAILGWCRRYLRSYAISMPGGYWYYSESECDRLQVRSVGYPVRIIVNGKEFKGEDVVQARHEIASLIRNIMIDRGMVVTF